MALENLTGPIDGDIHPDPDLEALRLLSLEQMQIPSLELGQLCLAALAKHGFVYRIAELASIHLAASKCYPAVLKLFFDFRERPEMQAPVMLQNHACACAQLGFYEQALHSVVQAGLSHHCPSDLLMDAQLLPLWHHYADHRPSLHESRLILTPAVSFILEDAESGSILDSVCDYEIEHALPRSFAVHMVRDLSSHYRMKPDTPSAVRQRFRVWRDNCRRRNVRLLRRVIQHAKMSPPPPANSMAKIHAHPVIAGAQRAITAAVFPAK